MSCFEPADVLAWLDAHPDEAGESVSTVSLLHAERLQCVAFYSPVHNHVSSACTKGVTTAHMGSDAAV